jgi:hypothetical protein
MAARASKTLRKSKLDEVEKISINLDTTPVFYTDNINIKANKHGVVLNVMQQVRNNKEMRIVSRVGMSREQARDFVEKLGNLLLMTEDRKNDRNDLN